MQSKMCEAMQHSTPKRSYRFLMKASKLHIGWQAQVAPTIFSDPTLSSKGIEIYANTMSNKKNISEQE